MSMNVLVTGGCGFLGSNIAAFYLNRGARVVVIDAFFRQGNAQNLSWLKDQNGELIFIKSDLANSKAVDALFQEYAPFDYVCHIGGQVAMTTSLSDPRRDMLTNVVGTFNVLESIRQYSPKAFLVYSSTNKVYGDLNHLDYQEFEMRYDLPDYPNGIDENMPLDFASPYGCSKGAADQYVHDWNRNYNLNTVVFRHSSIYGSRQFSTFDQGWVGWFCKKAIEQKRALDGRQPLEKFTISGSGKQVRDILHIRDAIQLYHSAYQNKERVAGEIFNIGGGVSNSTSLLELFNYLQDYLELSSPLEWTKNPRRKSDQDFFVADISKAKHMLQWEPLVTKEIGIQDMLDWYFHAETVSEREP